MTPATVLITGAANGMGRALSTALASRGHRLALLDRDDQIADLARTLSARCTLLTSRTARALLGRFKRSRTQLGPSTLPWRERVLAV